MSFQARATGGPAARLLARIRGVVCWGLCLIAGCGGGGGGAASSAGAAGADAAPLAAGSAPATVAANTVASTTVTLSTVTAAAPPPRGQPLGHGFSAYPRLIRLAHQADAAKSGLIVASLVESGPSGWRPGLYASADDGAGFAPLAAIADADFASGLCCGSLFELPQAVGYLPRGTLLYSLSVGADRAGSRMQNRIYASFDAGASWARLYDIDCGHSDPPRLPGVIGAAVWEPEFLLAGDGSLACVYSDETVPGRSQVLRLTQTRDGLHWSPPRVIVQGADASDRPGMANIRRLPDGSYLMSFESCSLSRLDCSVWLKTSADGLDWGAPTDFGVRPQTADGHRLRSTPTLTWAPLAGQAAGQLILSGQMLVDDQGQVDAARSSRVLMVNRSGRAAGDWQLIASPIGLPDPPTVSNWCQNYSSPVLPVAGESRLLMLQTDRPDGDATHCSTRFGTGSLR